LLAVVTVKPVPEARTGVSTRGSARHGLTWKNWLISAGRAEPRLKISTISGSPLAGSAQTSTCPTVDAGSASVIRRPAGRGSRNVCRPRTSVSNSSPESQM